MNRAQVKNPKQIALAMEAARTEWERDAKACDDGTAVIRDELRAHLGPWLETYPTADGAEQAVIEKDFKALLKRYERLPKVGKKTATKKARQVSPAQSGAGVKKKAAPKQKAAPASAKKPATAKKATAKKTDEAAPHAPVFLGPEGAVTGDSPEPEPKTTPAHLGPEAIVRDGSENKDASAAGGHEGDAAPSTAEKVGDAVLDFLGSASEMGGHLFAKWRVELTHQMLLRKQEGRLKELGERVRTLAEEGRLRNAAEDAGVARILTQVDQVEEAMRENRERLGTRPDA